jgi:hypothetical protein
MRYGKKVQARLNSVSMNTSSRIGSARLRRGFSLVEKLTMMAIMSIVTVLSMSSFSSLRSTSLTSSDNQMVDVFAMARQNSISKNHGQGKRETNGCGCKSIVGLDGTLSAQPAPLAHGLTLDRGTVDPSIGAFTYQGTIVSGQGGSYTILCLLAIPG